MTAVILDHYRGGQKGREQRLHAIEAALHSLKRIISQSSGKCVSIDQFGSSTYGVFDAPSRFAKLWACKVSAAAYGIKDDVGRSFLLTRQLSREVRGVQNSCVTKTQKKQVS